MTTREGCQVLGPAPRWVGHPQKPFLRHLLRAGRWGVNPSSHVKRKDGVPFIGSRGLGTGGSSLSPPCACCPPVRQCLSPAHCPQDLDRLKPCRQRWEAGDQIFGCTSTHSKTLTQKSHFVNGVTKAQREVICPRSPIQVASRRCLVASWSPVLFQATMKQFSRSRGVAGPRFRPRPECSQPTFGGGLLAGKTAWAPRWPPALLGSPFWSKSQGLFKDSKGI